MPGIQDFTYANIGKETTRGTPVAPTRQLYVVGTGVLDHDLTKSFHEAENRGVRTRVARSTTLAEDVNLKLKTADGLAFDDIPQLLMSPLKGGLTGTGAGADKTWTAVPSMTGANSPEAWTFDVGDDVQNWRVQYGMASRWKLSSGVGQLTTWEADYFGQKATKVAKATPSTNTGVKIVGDLWTIRFATTLAGLGAASVVSGFLLSWELDVSTGLLWRHYLDGTLQGGQHVETTISATLKLTVESTAQAVSQFYDKWTADTLDFIRLRNTGPTLGGSAYQATIDLPVLYDKPEPIGDEEEGVNLWTIPAKLAYDPTSGQSIGLGAVTSIATLP